MELVGVFLVVALPTLVGWALYSVEKKRIRDEIEDWRRVAAAVGLEDLQPVRKGVLGSSPRLIGRAGHLWVELWMDRSGNEASHCFAIGGLGHDAPGLTLHSEDLGSRVAKTLGEREVKIGDPAFDDQLYVKGSRALAQAIFDAETRLSTIRLFADASADVWLSEGVLHYESADSQVMPEWVERQLPLVLDVARQLSRPADVPGRLAANALRDPLPSARLAKLVTLVREFPNLPVTKDTLRAALDDASPGVRLRAARELGEEGKAQLLELALDHSGPEEIQAEALEALGDRLPLDEGQEVLSHALRSRRLAVAEACLAGLGQRGGPAVVAALTKVLAVEHGPLAVAASRALGASGEPSGEGPLVAALDRADEGLALAAAEALGQVGSAAAVSRLHRVEATASDQALRRAARQAVAQIQSRLTGATQGQLSLAEGESGQLSLAADERGRVSLPESGTASGDGETPRRGR